MTDLFLHFAGKIRRRPSFPFPVERASSSEYVAVLSLAGRALVGIEPRLPPSRDAS